MFKRILVATDGSENAQRAFLTALAIAEKFEAEIQLLYIVLPRDGAIGVSRDEDSEAEIQTAFAATRQLAREISVKIREKSMTGEPAAIILQEIRRDFDLVVMGSRGYGRAAGTVLGSVTQRVLPEADCPVLVVK